MKELEFLEIIKDTLSVNSHIGDDCAYLKDLGIVITQDSMVEDIHFLTKFSTPFQLGYKAIMVNLSDIYASGALPKYVTISLSLPNIDDSFVKEFYKACDDLSKEFGFEVIGGDITGSEKIFISICVIGLTKGRKISSRSHAKAGDYVVTTGVHGSSAAGLWLLQNKTSIHHSPFTIHHLMPVAQKEFSNEIAIKTDRDYAMMDTSDGLADALFKIAQASGVLISVDFDKIPYNKEIEDVAKMANVDFKDWVLYGGEDFQLVACLDEKNLKKLNADYNIIGRVTEKEVDHFVEVNFGDNIEKIKDLEKTYNHFSKTSSPLAGEDVFQHEFVSVRNSGEGYKVAHQYYAPYIKDFARNLRKNSTSQEKKLWLALKNKSFGFKFRRQFNLDNKYIADFVCLDKRLIIELDGGQHNGCFGDISRTFYLEKQNFRIIRFWNNEIDKNFDGCIEFLLNELDTPHLSPLPQGERKNNHKKSLAQGARVQTKEKK